MTDRIPPTGTRVPRHAITWMSAALLAAGSLTPCAATGAYPRDAARHTTPTDPGDSQDTEGGTQVTTNGGTTGVSAGATGTQATTGETGGDGGEDTSVDA